MSQVFIKFWIWVISVVMGELKASERGYCKNIMTAMIQKEIAILEQNGEQVYMKGVVRKRIWLTVILLAIGAALVFLEISWFFGYVVFIYFIYMYRLNEISYIIKLAKKSPDKPVSEIIRENSVMKPAKRKKSKNGNYATLMQRVVKQRKNLFLICVIGFCATLVVLPLFEGKTDMELEECAGGYRLVSFEPSSSDLIVTIPSEYNGKPVVAIGEKAFERNYTIEKIIVPDTVVEIGEQAFAECNKLKEVKLSENLTVMGVACFEGTPLESIMLPESLKELPDRTFAGCISLKKVEAGENLTAIGKQCFKGCYSLESIVLPDSVKQLGDKAFEGCGGLVSVELPDGITKIGRGMFKECKALKTVEIPPNVISIEKEAFRDCEELMSVTMYEKVAEIGEYAFLGCDKLPVIRMPEHTVVSESAMRGITRLRLDELTDAM